MQGETLKFMSEQFNEPQILQRN